MAKLTAMTTHHIFFMVKVSAAEVFEYQKMTHQGSISYDTL